MVHNGNVINYADLKKVLFDEYSRILNSDNDVEVILNVFAQELAKQNTRKTTTSFSAIGENLPTSLNLNLEVLSKIIMINANIENAVRKLLSKLRNPVAPIIIPVTSKSKIFGTLIFIAKKDNITPNSKRKDNHDKASKPLYILSTLFNSKTKTNLKMFCF